MVDEKCLFNLLRRGEVQPKVLIAPLFFIPKGVLLEEELYYYIQKAPFNEGNSKFNLQPSTEFIVCLSL